MLACFHLLGLVSFFTFPFAFETPRNLYSVLFDIEFWIFPAIFALTWGLISLLVVLHRARLHRMGDKRTLKFLAVGTCAVLLAFAVGAIEWVPLSLTLFREFGADLPAPTLLVLAAYEWWLLIPALAAAATIVLYAAADIGGKAARLASGGLIGALVAANTLLFGTLFSLFLPFFKMCGNPDLASGHTRLHAAAMLGRIESAQRLIDRGAAVSARDVNGETPLHLAASGPHLAVLDALLAKGADANARTEGGRTPLHAAAVYGRIDIAERLLAHGARVEEAAADSGQPLHIAAFRGHADFAALLLARGADVDAEDRDGLTPLDRAYEAKQAQVAALLAERGAQRSTKESRARAARRHKPQASRETRAGSCSV